MKLTCSVCKNPFSSNGKNTTGLCIPCARRAAARRRYRLKAAQINDAQKIEHICTVCSKTFRASQNNSLGRCDSCKKSDIKCNTCNQFYKLGKRALGECKKCAGARKAKKWYKDNYKQFYQKNKEKIKARTKEWYKNNQEQARETRQAYYERHREHLNQQTRAFFEENPTYKQEYYENNKEKILKDTKRRQEERRKVDPYFKLLHNLRSRLRGYVRGEGDNLIECLGCSKNELKAHLESLFQEGMNWDNYGNKEGCWSVDHIIPVTAFDISDPEARKKINHYSNLQPMWHIENIKKGGAK